MHPVVRPAVTEDVPAVTRIYAHAVENGTASFELQAPGEAEMERRMRVLLDGAFPYLVAEIEDTVAGYAYAAPYRTRPAYGWTVEDSVYVSPENQRRGVGRALLAALIAESETRGYRQMIAVIGDSANEGSIALHRAAGFEPAGTLRDVGFKFGRWVDSVLMQRTLGEGGMAPPE